MASPRFQLHGSASDRTLIDDIDAGHEVVGLSGVLDARGHRATRARVPGTGVYRGYRWRFVDFWDSTWWPQGIAPTEHNGIPLLVTSWFAQEKRGNKMGARISIIDLRNSRRPRYHHVLLVSPTRRGGSIHYDPVHVHAGGIVVAGDRLLVAATYGGIREFRLSDIIRTPRRRRWGAAVGPFGYRFVLPESVGYRPPPAPAAERLRYSFLGLETSTPLPSTDDVPSPPPSAANNPVGDSLTLVTGEYSTKDNGRVCRMVLGDGVSTIEATHTPVIPRMQGVGIHNGVWFVTSSAGDKHNGDLWVGEPGAMIRHVGALPPGPEDIAAWPERNQLWSVSEFPWKRWIYALDLTQWTDRTRNSTD